MNVMTGVQQKITKYKVEDDDREIGIAIGIICPEAFTPHIEYVLKSFPSFKPIIRAYNNEEQAPVLSAELMDDVEVLLFTGPIPYRRARDKMVFTIPAHYIPLTGTGLYRSLFLLQKKINDLRVSIDTVSASSVEKMWVELGEPSERIFVYDDSPNPSRAELVQFHHCLFVEGQTAAALTGVKSVADELTRLGVPNEWIVPTKQDIIVSLERALLSTRSRRDKESQIVVGLINIDQFDRLAEKQNSEHEVQRLKLDIHRLLLGYVESLDGHLTHLGGDEYLFVTTRGIFERETGGYKTLPLAKEAAKSLGISLSVGIGFGSSANQAGTHARIALRQSKEAGGGVGFIVREDRGVIGPLEMSEPWEVDLSLIDADLIKRVEKMGMTSVYLSKLIVDVSRHGRTEYTAQELAALLGVTVRTAHRLLVVWLDEQLVSIAGEERSNGKGRPKQIYDLSFIADIVRKFVR